MDKLTAIRIKYDDGTYSDEIPINVLAENVEWDDTNNLIDILGSVAIDDQGSIQQQLDQLFLTKVDTTSLNNYINTNLKEDVEDWLDQYVSPATGTIAYDASLSIEGAAADAKAAGQIVQISSTKPTKENNRIWVANAEEEYQIPTMDEFNTLKNDLSELQGCFVNDSTEGEQVTLTNMVDITAFMSAVSGDGFSNVRIVSNVFMATSSDGDIVSPYITSSILPVGTLIVGFKFRFNKIDVELNDPENFRVIIGLGADTRDYSPSFNEWLEYSNVVTIDTDKSRIRLSARNFPTAPTSGQLTLEIKEMYVYEVSGVSSEMRTFIREQQSSHYQDGTVTYGEAVITSFIPDNTLALPGKVAESKAVGDALSSLTDRVDTLESDFENTVNDLDDRINTIDNILTDVFVTEGFSVIMTNLRNTQTFFESPTLSAIGMRKTSFSSGVAVYTSADSDITSPYIQDYANLGEKKWICGFKYRVSKIDQAIGDPENYRIHLGGNAYDHNVVWGEWINFAQFGTIDLFRIRFAARNFASISTNNTFKVEIKEMYLYDATGVSDEICSFIVSQQNTNYQDGVVVYSEGSFTYTTDASLTMSGKAADAKAVGDAIESLNGIEKVVSNESVTLTDQNPATTIFTSGTWKYVSKADGIYTFVPQATDANVYGTNSCNLGTGKHLVSFKYRLTKIDVSISDPTDVRIILGASERYTYTDYQYDSWIEFTKITETDLTRVYLSVRGFSQVPTAEQFKLEIKDFYIYDISTVIPSLYNTIIRQQNESYQSGTVTYSDYIVSSELINSEIEINVRNFGVKGDGVTDDTDAINNLFSTRRGNFYFPSGTYKISGTIILPSKSTMYGDGDQTIIDMYSCDNLEECVFRGGDRIYPYIRTNSYTKLFDFKLVGNNTNLIQRHAGILIPDSENCFVTNVTIYNINYNASQTDPNVSAYGICVLRSYRVYIDHCYVEQCGYECIGIADLSHHCVVSNCITKNGWRTCIQVHRGAYDVDIIGNQMIQDSQAWDACFTLHGLQDEYLVKNLRIENNTFKATVASRPRLEDYASVVQLMSYCDGLWFINNRVVAGDRNLCATSSISHLILMGNLFQCGDTSDYRIKIYTSDPPIIIGNIVENTDGTTQTIPASAIVSGNIGLP